MYLWRYLAYFMEIGIPFTVSPSIWCWPNTSWDFAYMNSVSVYSSFSDGTFYSVLLPCSTLILSQAFPPLSSLLLSTVSSNPILCLLITMKTWGKNSVMQLFYLQPTCSDEAALPLPRPTHCWWLFYWLLDVRRHRLTDNLQSPIWKPKPRESVQAQKLLRPGWG